ncbi:MAG: 3-phosphoglycerate dehydrogenase, partial [Verrucomicrobia bacterium]|nr:3-phosphoglycerate dehydrogenase [Verrucomicrobiota bacterium]
MKVLLTTTSFQDTPGPHHDLLKNAGFDLICERGPLTESRMLELVGDIDAFLCGDDDITRAVIDKSLPKLKVISKYGIGLDKIDTDYVAQKEIPLTFCPGVNHTTVAEHTFALMLALFRKLVKEANHVANGEWVRVTGNEIMGKTIAIIGLGRIGKEVAKRCNGFDMNIYIYDPFVDDKEISKYGYTSIGKEEGL